MAASTQADLLGNRYGHLAYRRRVINYSTGSTATYFVSPRESGALFYVPAVSTAKFSLPKISSLAKGLTYDFYVEKSADERDVNIVSTIDSSAHIVGVHGTTGTTISTNSAISPASTVAFANAIKLTAVSSVVWFAEAAAHLRTSGADVIATSAFMIFGEWTSGTTAA